MIEIIIDFIDSYQLLRINRFIRKFRIDTIIDVGAHKGDFVKHALKYLKPKKIYVFEPQKEFSHILKKRFKKKVKVFNLAVGKKNSYNFIYINKLKKTSTLNNAIVYSNSIYNKFKNLLLLQKRNYESKYRVKTVSLDYFFSKKKLFETLLKIDVEGYEANVLLGSKKILKKIQMVLIEKQNLKKNNFHKCHEILLKSNFIHHKTFLFPLMQFEDRLYVKKKLI
jgi:FkbM family methyltransferase